MKKNMFLLRIIDMKVKKFTKGMERSVYGSGTCIIGITEEKILLPLETYCYRRMLRIGRINHLTNEGGIRRMKKQEAF